MESQPLERTPQEMALNNPIILMEIFKQTSTPLKTCRLVCQFWNEMVLSLPNTRLALKLNDEFDRNKNTYSFFDLCFSLNDRLAKRIRASCHTEVTDDFAFRVTLFCDKFSDIVQILELSIDSDSLQYIHQVLTNCCPNLQQLRIFCGFTIRERILMEPLPPKLKLTSFVLTAISKVQVWNLTSFAQVVVNASKNLREVTLPWGMHLNLKKLKFLDSLTIALNNLSSRHINRFKSSELSRMLNQIGHQLVTLGFGASDDMDTILDSKNWNRQEFRIPGKMSKLKKYRNVLVDVFQCDDVLQDLQRMPALTTLVIGKTFGTGSAGLHEYLQTIFNAKKVFGNVKILKIFEMHDRTLLEGLKTAFPNLVRLLLGTNSRTGDDGEGMELGGVLKACVGWVGLKHLELWLPLYPKEIMGVIKALLDGVQLYKKLKTLTIMECWGDWVIRDLTEVEMDMFKQLLLAMDGMDQVEIHDLYLSKESARDIFEFMESNKMSVSKFKIFSGKTYPDYEEI
ncbi:uncharacterized protein LOC118439330 [Folsomia candida]|uniref:uncharacterized protein LOC118439330 n=1 Tax=Folsomia candida TaxID=158441 RepID=UPI001604D952|nr:uncharacterized protein LOC118439330 [Folsomia candida]